MASFGVSTPPLSNDHESTTEEIPSVEFLEQEVALLDEDYRLNEKIYNRMPQRKVSERLYLELRKAHTDNVTLQNVIDKKSTEFHQAAESAWWSYLIEMVEILSPADQNIMKEIQGDGDVRSFYRFKAETLPKLIQLALLGRTNWAGAKKQVRGKHASPNCGDQQLPRRSERISKQRRGTSSKTRRCSTCGHSNSL